MGHQIFSQQFFGSLLDFIMRSANLDAASFTARTGMNLRFDNPHVAINLPGALYGFHHAVG